MMTKLKGKKLTLALVLLLALSLVAVGTYAWFTDSVTTNPIGPELGTLLIGADVDFDDSQSIYYQPGMNPVEVAGVIENKGTLPFCAKITLNVQTTLRWDVTTKAVKPNPNDWTTLTPDWNIPATIDTTGLQSWVSASSGDAVLWYKDLNDPRVFYVMMTPGTDDEIPVVITLPHTLGNEYMAAQIKLDADWKATQTLSGAILDEFGVDLADGTLFELLTPQIVPGEDHSAFLNEVFGVDFF